MSSASDTVRKLLRVLIVEDEGRLRELLLDVVPEMGYPATAVRSAEDAVRVMQLDPHDVLILDLQLPVMGGLDLFERVRRDWPEAQVIILTGFGDLSAAQRAIHLDVVEFLSKPCHLRDVELALERARPRAASSAWSAIFEEGVAAEHAIDNAKPVKTLAESEHEQILAALRRNEGNRTAAAADLGISRRKLHYRLAAYRRTEDLID